MNNFTLNLYKAFGLRKASMYPFDMSAEQYDTLQEHFKDILIHKDNTFFTYDNDGNILDTLTNEIVETPEDARYKYNTREAWHDFLTTMGPWYARGLYGRVHKLPHEDSSAEWGERLPTDHGNLYDDNPKRYIRQSDYSAPNQWHSRLDFEQGIPGEEHPNNLGHVRKEGVKFPPHNKVYDNHWFGSLRYWGPYDLEWFKNGHHDDDVIRANPLGDDHGSQSEKVTVNNAEEGYHPDIYERFGGEHAKALPFLGRDVLYRHHMEDSARNIYGPDPLKWPEDSFTAWGTHGDIQNHHFPPSYGYKYWKTGNYDMEIPPRPSTIDPKDFKSKPPLPPNWGTGKPGNSPPPIKFDPNEWENRMKKMLWKAFGIKNND